MNYTTVTTDRFDSEVKRLSKKYRSLPDDLKTLRAELLENPRLGDDLGNNTRKVRMAVASKNKGKSGGARVITYHFLINEMNGKIYLLSIYDKGERSSISQREIAELKRENGLI